MSDQNFLKDTLQPIIVSAGFFLSIVGFILAYRQYLSQQKFKRLQNLSTLWKGFAANPSHLALFNLMDEIESGSNEQIIALQNYDRQIKFSYLALIEEVSLYAELSEVDRSYAAYLFQWHFYYCYQSKMTASAFWQNIGGESEMKATYWSKSREFAKNCNPQ